MNKYTSFFRLRFVYGLSYRAAAAGGIATQFAWGILNILLYKAFYDAANASFPMEFTALTAYIWIQQAFWAMFTVWLLENEIFDAIHSGGIAYELCRPVDLYHMWFVRSMANRLSKAVLRCMPILIFAIFLPAPYGLTMPKAGGTFAWFLVSMALAFLVLISFGMLIYEVTFYTISPAGIRMVTAALIEFLSGAIIPLPFFPEKVRVVLELLPFASMQNAPLLIYSGNIKGVLVYKTILLQVIWLAVLYTAGKFLMKSIVKKAVIQGG